ncbi:MAG: hypothetical protein LC776_17165, partial [Acidobacteria bacterium]|nr:hypothetical protein [Acidobacteriota bacterium]
MRTVTIIVLLCTLACVGQAQQAASDERLRELERKLEQATLQIEQLKDTVRSLRAEIERIKNDKS